MNIRLAMGTALLAGAVAAPCALAQNTVRVAPRERTVTALTNMSYLGIGVQDVDADRAKALKIAEPRGAEVTSVTPDSPAAKAGFKDGDVVLEYNGQRIEGQEQLSRMVRETPTGRQVKVSIWRNGAAMTLTPTVEPRKANNMIMLGDGERTFVMPEIRIPSMPAMPDMPNGMVTWNNPMLGVVGEALSSQEQFADFMGVKDGVLVKSVNKNSAAEKAGIKAGDVIVKVEDAKISTTRDITAALRAAHSKKTVTVVVIRNKKETPITVTVEAAPTGSTIRAQVLGMPELQVLRELPRMLNGILANQGII